MKSDSWVCLAGRQLLVPVALRQQASSNNAECVVEQALCVRQTEWGRVVAQGVTVATGQQQLLSVAVLNCSLLCR
jgi:hypothetical protein